MITRHGLILSELGMHTFRATKAGIKRFVAWFSTTGNPVPESGQTLLMRPGVEMTNLGNNRYKIVTLSGYRP